MKFIAAEGWAGPFVEHVDWRYAGQENRCGHSWGVLAPESGLAGVLHWCNRVTTGGPITALIDHGGDHVCGCKAHVNAGEARVTCQQIDRSGLVVRPSGERVCGRECTGVQRTRYVVPKSLRLRRPEQRIMVVQALPCLHFVRRGFAIPPAARPEARS